MHALNEAFSEQALSRGLWPPRSPDLNPCDFYFRGALKEDVYVHSPHSFGEFQENIMHEISTIPVQQLQRVSKNIFSRFETCLEAEGRQFETLL
jgi:hypothetical protein